MSAGRPQPPQRPLRPEPPQPPKRPEPPLRPQRPEPPLRPPTPAGRRPRPQRHWLLSRIRQIAMLLVFDLGGPLLTFSLLRRHGMGDVDALIVSGVCPALGIAITAVVDRRLDLIGVVVLAGLVVGTILGLTSHNARLYLLEGAVPSLVFALACLGSLRASKPLIYRFAIEIIGPDTLKGREVTGAWQYPGFRRAYRVITVAWGVAYLIEVASRLVVVEIASTGIALLFSKLVPYLFAVSLSIWTLGYGEHEKKKAEQLAAARSPGIPVAVAAEAGQ